MDNITNPFFTNGAIDEPRHFIGRSALLREIFNRVFNETPQSVNLWGEARYGKSSVLRQVHRTYEDRSPNPSAIVAVYIEFGRTNADSELAFYRAIAEALLDAIPRKRSGFFQRSQRNALEQALKLEPFDRVAFDKAMRAWKAAGILPLLCLDEFQYLLNKPDVFPDGFYEVLRALMDDCAVMLVVGSRKMVAQYAEMTHAYTSRFFTLLHPFQLGDLEEVEAQDLVRLPLGDPALSSAYQRLAREWGDRQPFRLQVAGLCLYEAQRNGQSVQEARRQFEAITAGRPQGWRDWRNWARLVFWRLPIAVTTSSTWVGENAKELQKVVPGAVIIVVVVLFSTGRLTPETLGTVWKLFKDPIELLTKPAEPEGDSKSP